MEDQNKILFYHYNEKECFFSDSLSLKECAAFDRSNHVSWINIIGIKNVADVQEAADLFNIHPLAVEDIVHTEQRAKVDDYGDFYFVVLRIFALIENKIEDQQVSFIVKDNLVISFREKGYGIFKKQLGDKLVVDTGSIRKPGEDHLLYRLLDVVIDNYYFVLQYLDTKLEKTDTEIMKKPGDHHIVHLQMIKSELLYMRKNILPARDMINTLIRNEVEFFDAVNKYYLRDLHDHMIRNIEELDFQREQVNSLMDFFYSLQTHKMNNIMRTLTIVSFIFLPLTFIASLYGMNFDIIPRAADRYGFWEVVAGMGALAMILVIFAFRRQWLSSRDFLKEKI